MVRRLLIHLRFFRNLESLHQRAMRTFLGVGKKTPIPALYGDIGWHRLISHRKRDIVRYWTKLYNMNNNRLTKRVFNWDYRKALEGKPSWNKEVKSILEANNLTEVFYGLDVEAPKKVLKVLAAELEHSDNDQLQNQITSMPKLRTYKEIKLSPGTEYYITSNMTRQNRSLLAKFRSGTFKINIELGRYKRLPVRERTCPWCPGEVEDERHFLLHCPSYRMEREVLLDVLQRETGENPQTLEPQQMLYLLTNIKKLAKQLAQFLGNALNKRSDLLKQI